MSKYLFFHVWIGLDAAFPLHLSRLQLEAAEVTWPVPHPDTRSSAAPANSNRQEGGKGGSALPLSRTFYLTPNLFLNEPATAGRVALRLGCAACSGGSTCHNLTGAGGGRGWWWGVNSKPGRGGGREGDGEPRSPARTAQGENLGWWGAVERHSASRSQSLPARAGLEASCMLSAWGGRG